MRVSFMSFSHMAFRRLFPKLITFCSDHLEKNPQRDRSDKGRWCSIRYRWLNEGRKQRGEERDDDDGKAIDSSHFRQHLRPPLQISLGRSERGCFKNTGNLIETRLCKKIKVTIVTRFLRYCHGFYCLVRAWMGRATTKEATFYGKGRYLTFIN